MAGRLIVGTLARSDHVDLVAALEHLSKSKEHGEHAGLPENRYRWFIAMAGVKQAESRGVDLGDLTDGEYAAISEHLTPEVRTVLSTEGSLNSRNSQGGTAPAAVERQLVALEAELKEARHYAG